MAKNKAKKRLKALTPPDPPDLNKARNDLHEATAMLRTIKASLEDRDEASVLRVAISLVESVRETWDDWDHYVAMGGKQSW
jgi:hypothetical protein